ncbi:MAG: PEP/pyruvate-binding domain-containing protein, partial [Thermaurantiacus sp.]
MPERLLVPFGGDAPSCHALGKEHLGGKGANCAEMAGIGLPVPPGFIIPTPLCTAYAQLGNRLPEDLVEALPEGLAHIETAVGTGARFGDPENPLLVSVRSGARVSMPGMMDTVLNLGLNDATVEGLATRSGDLRFAWDSYRRFVQMYGDVVLGLDHYLFEEALELLKEDRGVALDTALSAEDMKALVHTYLAIVERKTGKPFPQDPKEQLRGAVAAVFGSWQSDRARVYRRINAIPEDWGTAVTVQAMVFGNMGEDSATGVAFTRDPATGEKRIYGEYLVNAQGEDVVAGIRTPDHLTRAAREAAGAKGLAMEEAMPAVYAQLRDIFELLERHYRDCQDIEFTVQQGFL